MIAWAWDGREEPPEVSAASLIASAEWVDDYAKPMAERVYGDAALPQVERNAAVLARYIVKQGFRTINLRHLSALRTRAACPASEAARY
jgi:putative DNA primase/helicase